MAVAAVHPSGAVRQCRAQDRCGESASCQQSLVTHPLARSIRAPRATRTLIRRMPKAGSGGQGQAKM